MKTLRLVAVPVLITVLLSAVRLAAEVNGWIASDSGGALHPLGISWLPFVFGIWFAVRIARTGSRPRTSAIRVVAPVLLLAVFACIPWQFAPFFEADHSDVTYARLRVAVLTLATIATAAMLADFAMWPKLAWTMLCYAVPSRLFVFALTWFAKLQPDWDTHYTKFGPPGIERDLPETLVATAIAQGGFWVPFTVVCGVAAGAAIGPWRGAAVRRAAA